MIVQLLGEQYHQEDGITLSESVTYVIKRRVLYNIL